MARQLRFVAWNADDVSARRAELAAFAVEYDADVNLLSETHLAPGTNFSLPPYTCYRQNRVRPAGHPANGGMAIIVHRWIPPPATSRAVALNVYGSEVRLVSTYLHLDARRRCLRSGTPSSITPFRPPQTET